MRARSPTRRLDWIDNVGERLELKQIGAQE